jgi:hypothetical protein
LTATWKDELQFHLAMCQDRLEEQGVPPDEAHYAAQREFGNATAAKAGLTSASICIGFRAADHQPQQQGAAADRVLVRVETTWHMKGTVK